MVNGEDLYISTVCQMTSATSLCAGQVTLGRRLGEGQGTFFLVVIVHAQGGRSGGLWWSFVKRGTGVIRGSLNQSRLKSSYMLSI